MEKRIITDTNAVWNFSAETEIYTKMSLCFHTTMKVLQFCIENVSDEMENTILFILQNFKYFFTSLKSQTWGLALTTFDC